LEREARGPPSFGEVGNQLPFEVKRYFLVFDVSTEEIRGERYPAPIPDQRALEGVRFELIGGIERARRICDCGLQWVAVLIKPAARARRSRSSRRPLRPARRKYAEPAAALYSIRVEVGMIHGENGRQGLTLCEMHESCICEIHRRIRIARHQ